MTTPFEKAKTLRDIRREARLEALPADDPRYVPLDAARGQHVVKRFLKLLEHDGECLPQEPDAPCVHLAYAGHRGCGKTTELNRLKKQLEEDGIYCAYFDAHPELVMGDLEYTDVLLYIAQKMLEDVAKQVELDPRVLEPVEHYFTEVTEISREEIKKEVSLETSARAEGGVPFLFKLLAGITARIGGSASTAKELRTRLQKRPDQLIGAVNLLLDHVTEKLKELGQNKPLLILDSLDRLQPPVVERAILLEARVFTQLHINLILTVPLASIYIPSGESLTSQGIKVIALPMVSVRDKDQSWSQENAGHVDTLCKLIHARIDVNAVFENPELVREMVLLSGGSFRELFELLGEAALEADELPITRAHFEVGARQVWRAYSAPLRFEDRKMLVRIHQDKQVDHTPDAFRLLFHRFALEYNGRGWADVHPLIMQFDERFKTLLESAP
ncbi:hypothetical protein [Desulfolutivibrio sp.]|uniref:hypothetical protein n=1 Tax=Desulfolutivibrio sp. TaxID=2773296 RepID=UPI002F962F39